MNRPLYESEANRSDEHRIGEIVGRKWDCTFRKLPLAYIIDYVAIRSGNPTGWAEIKHRNFEFGHYDDFIIGLNKYRAAIHYKEDTGLWSGLIIEFEDKIYFHEPRLPIVTGWGGRTDRGDWQDQEPMARVSWTDFKEIR